MSINPCENPRIDIWKSPYALQAWNYINDACGTYVRQDKDEHTIVAHLAGIVEKKFKDVSASATKIFAPYR